MKHTKGPWRIHKSTLHHSDKNPHIEVLSPNGSTICEVNWSRDFVEINPDKCTPNAHLIASAPELLEALAFIANVAQGKANDKTKVIEFRFERDTLLTWLGKAQSAIKKATE